MLLFGLKNYLILYKAFEWVHFLSCTNFLGIYWRFKWNISLEKSIKTYRNQSTENIKAIMSVGKPTVSNTISMVTRPACGIAAAPTEAKIDVKLREK